MKIGILTFNNTLNFGAVLQAYALQETINSFGHYAEIIKYINKYIEEKEKNTSFSVRTIISKIAMGDGIKRKEIAFKEFEKNNMHFGMTLDNNDEINNYYDKFITGIDQVWNMKITNADWTFFLDFVKDNSKRISYAPSFGDSYFPQEHYQKASDIFNIIRKKSPSS